MSEKYYSISPYVYVANNPMKYTDPTGMFLFDKKGMENGTHYGVVTVLPSNYESISALKHDYNVAIKEGILVLLVDNIQDFAAGMEDMRNNDISVTSYVLNSHGSEGYAKIGMEGTTNVTDFGPLKAGLSGTNVFLGSCAMTRGSSEAGLAYIQNLSEITNTTVVSSDHSILSGYKYDGSHYLSKPYGELTEKKKAYRSYHLATPKDGVKQIFDFTIDKKGKFSWQATFDDEVQPK